MQERYVWMAWIIQSSKIHDFNSSERGNMGDETIDALLATRTTTP